MTGQEVTKSTIKKNAPDNSLASVLLAAAFLFSYCLSAMFLLFKSLGNTFDDFKH